MLHYVHSQFCAIRELFSDQELTHSSIDKLETFPQLISNEVFVYQISYGYVSKFLDHETFNFWEVLNFSPPTEVFQVFL